MFFRQKTSPRIATRVNSNGVLPNLMKFFSQKIQKCCRSMSENDFHISLKIYLFCQFSQSDIKHAVLQTLPGRLSTIRSFFHWNQGKTRYISSRIKLFFLILILPFFPTRFQPKSHSFYAGCPGKFHCFSQKKYRIGTLWKKCERVPLE